jgi:hypothetical protein
MRPVAQSHRLELHHLKTITEKTVRDNAYNLALNTGLKAGWKTGPAQSCEASAAPAPISPEAQPATDRGSSPE